MTNRGVVKFQIDDDLINETYKLAKQAAGQEKLTLYKQLRFFRLHKGKWLVKMDYSDE